MKFPRLVQCVAALIVLACGPVAAQERTVLDYPREYNSDGMRAKIHHPVIDSWADYAVLEAWVPVEVTVDANGRQWVGALRARAQTQVKLAEGMVLLDRQEITGHRFSDPQTPPEVIDFAVRSLGNGRQEVTLDEVLLSLADDFQPPTMRRDPGFNRMPPRIEVSTEPVSLLLIDEQPVRAPIADTELELVVNTDWTLFYDREGRDWYVINDGVWQNQSLLASGAWSTVSELPADFQKLANGVGWQVVRDAWPPKLPASAPPALLVSLEPTELILIDGEPALQAIPGTAGLMEVANSARDLFQFEGRWYFLAAGRWFESASLEGPWDAVDELPATFADIPQDHGRAAVRAAIPGTREATIAYLAATLPQVNSVGVDESPAQAVVYVGEPRFEPIAQTRVERAVNTPFAVLRHNNSYYLNYEAAWYRSASAKGPWKPALILPEEIFAIPPSDPLHYVTYVRPAGNQPANGQARFSYTEGYNGMYTIGRNAVRGTGWAYKPWVAYPGGSPVYWGYAPTYGGAYPYRHSAYYWGAYAPMQRVTIDGPARTLDGARSVAEQDRRLTRSGYDYTTLAQQRLDDSRAAGYLADDLFADPEGQVYRRSDDGWSRHDGGNWNTMDELARQYGVSDSGPAVATPEGQQRQAYRQNPEDVERMERYFERRSKSYNAYMNVYVPR